MLISPFDYLFESEYATKSVYDIFPMNSPLSEHNKDGGKLRKLSVEKFHVTPNPWKSFGFVESIIILSLRRNI